MCKPIAPDFHVQIPLHQRPKFFHNTEFTYPPNPTPNYILHPKLSYSIDRESKTFQNFLQLPYLYHKYPPLSLAVHSITNFSYPMACSASSTALLSSNPKAASISPKSSFQAPISQCLSVPSSFNGLRNCKPFVSRVARSLSTRVAQSQRRRFVVRASVSFSFTPFFS